MDKNENKVQIQFPIVIDSAAKLSRLQMMLTEDWRVVHTVSHKDIALLILEIEVPETEKKRIIKHLRAFSEADEELASINSIMPGL